MRGIEYLALTVILAATAVYFITPGIKNNQRLPQTAFQSAEVTSSKDAGCHYRRALPDPNCTPGALNSDITQDNIDQTICNPNWTTKSIRPSVSYTDNLKRQQLQEYGASDQSTKDFEEDHLIPLEVGGNPTDPKNLWPEPRLGSPNSSNKDKLENYLHDQVCSGALTLQQAQTEISTNWVQYWQAAHLP